MAVVVVLLCLVRLLQLAVAVAAVMVGLVVQEGQVAAVLVTEQIQHWAGQAIPHLHRHLKVIMVVKLTEIDLEAAVVEQVPLVEMVQALQVAVQAAQELHQALLELL
jgi:hypothetical protein